MNRWQVVALHTPPDDWQSYATRLDAEREAARLRADGTHVVGVWDTELGEYVDLFVAVGPTRKP